MEELGINKEVDEINFLFCLTLLQPVMEVYIFTTKFDGRVITCNEFESAGWKTTEEIDELLEKKLLCPDTEIFYKQFKESLIKTNI